MCALRTKNVLTWQHALSAYVLTCQRVLSAYLSHLSACLVCLRTHLSTWLATPRTHAPTCLESLAPHGLRDHVITCQYALLPQYVVWMSLFSVSLPLLLKLYTLLVRLFFLSKVNSYIIQAC